MNILILCAHVDDEIGCSGTITKFVERGDCLKVMTFSACEESFEQRFYDKYTGIGEFNRSMEVLDVSGSLLLKYIVRCFPQNRQNILESMVKQKKVFKPNIVFTPASSDIHQDHHTIYQESLRAFKHCTLLGYELPQNTIQPHSNTLFMRLKWKHIEKKLNAMKCYKSQSDRNYMSENLVIGLAGIRGAQCNSKYAEAFEVIRMII